MRYEEYYYKNLCEKYQKRIDILKNYLLEAGLMAAMSSGNPELLKKEYLRQKARKELKLDRAGRKNLRYQQIAKNNPAKSGSYALSAQTDMESARQLGSNIEEIGMQLGTEYPEEYRKVKNLRGSTPYPSTPEMTANFFLHGTRSAPHSSNATY